MQQFTVPQFIDVEDKILGPITVRQFLILLAGSVFIGIAYKFFDFTLFIFSGILILLISGVIAFLKINGMPFHYFLLNFFQTLKKPNLRVWDNKMNIDIYIYEKENEVVSEVPIFKHKSFAVSRLNELALIVDTQGVYRGENRGNKIISRSSENNLA